LIVATAAGNRRCQRHASRRAGADGRRDRARGGRYVRIRGQFGNVTIGNFDPGTDAIEIDHTVFADFQALLAAVHDDGNGNA
jgi:hypothetical protein